MRGKAEVVRKYKTIRKVTAETFMFKQVTDTELRQANQIQGKISEVCMMMIGRGLCLRNEVQE